MHAFVNALSNVMPCFCRRVRPGMLRSRPAAREVLDRALLVGQEDEHVHAAQPAAGGARPVPAADGGGSPAEQDAGRGDGRGLQQLAAGDARLCSSSASLVMLSAPGSWWS